MRARGDEGSNGKSTTRAASGCTQTVATTSWQLLALAVLLWISVVPSHGQADPGASKAKIVVGTMRVPPFVLRSDTFRGRALALVWMFASIFLVTLFTATLASSFFVGRLKTGINGPGDLARARVVGVAGTAGEQWLNAQGLAARSYPFVIQATKALQRGDVQALVYERAILGHMIKEYGWRDLQVLPHILAVRDYAIALPTDSRFKEPINRALLKIVHRPDWKDLVQRYVGGTDQTALTDGP
jgi:Bacterial extracellular solute-binding proteins, family 3/Ligand-gated ion channel